MKVFGLALVLVSSGALVGELGVGEGTGKTLGIQASAYTDKKDIVALLGGQLEKGVAVVTPKGTCPVRAALSVPRPAACSTSCSTEITR